MIQFTQGDAAVLNLTATDGNGNPVDLTGASFVSSMLGPQGLVVQFPNGQHTANPDQVNFRGQFTLALADTDTVQIDISPLNGSLKDILTQVTIAGAPITYRARILSVLPPVPLQ